MIILSESRLRSEIIKFIQGSVDEDLRVFYGKFGTISFSLEEFEQLSDGDKKFIRADLIGIVETSFDGELMTAIKFYQIMHCMSFHGVTNHNPPRFKFKEMSPQASEMFLQSEGIIDE